MKTCQHIEYILKLAEAEKNTILSISKSELMNKVVWMNNPLSLAAKDKIQSKIKGVEYKTRKNRPHDPGVEYYACNNCKVSIVFPLNCTHQ